MKKLVALIVAIVAITSVNARKTSASPTPKKADEVVKFTPPVITVTGKKAGDFYRRNPTVADISRQCNVVSLTMKDQTTEKYDMSKKKEKDVFVSKYGKSPIPPPQLMIHKDEEQPGRLQNYSIYLPG